MLSIAASDMAQNNDVRNNDSSFELSAIEVFIVGE